MATETTAPVQPNVNGAAAEKDPRYIAVTVDAEWLAAIRKAAGDLPLATYVKTILARELKLTVPDGNPRKKYATEEEKKAALKEQREERNELVKRLLKEHKAKLAAAAAAK